MPSSAAAHLSQMRERARKVPVVLVELVTRQDAGYTVSLEWERDTGETQIVVADPPTRASPRSSSHAPTPATRFAIRSDTRRDHQRS